jgi:hypothetical protein
VSESVTLIVSWVANLIQIGAFIFSIYVLWRAKRRLANALKTINTQLSAQPIALAIGLGNDIQAAVQRHLTTARRTMPIKSYHRSGLVPRKEFHGILRDLLKIKQELTSLGVTEVHLFYMGPVTLSVGIGAILDNWVPVHVYKYVEGGYEEEFVLHKETVLGLLDEVVDVGVDIVT